MKLITTTDDLAAFCKPLADTEFIAVDTEFMRERTYWPKLCLAQVAGPDDAAAIDALADGIDLAPLDELMANPKVLKVFHAARQDLEIFYLRMNKVPQPLFDTQVAAMVCGHGEAASYESLATKLAKAKIDKSSRFTDWSRRPLSERQIAYALSDVTHLRVVYEKLKRQLDKTGRFSWIAEEMAVQNEPGTYRLDPEQAWRRLKPRGASPRLLGTLREVAAWRERTLPRRVERAECDELRQPRLQPRLHGPDDRDDEQRESQRREHRLRDAQRGDHQDRGADAYHRMQGAFARPARPRNRIAHRVGAVGLCHSVQCSSPPAGTARQKPAHTEASFD